MGGGLVDFTGAVEGCLNVGHDVFAAEAVKEACAAEELGGLLHGTAEDQGAAGVVQALGEGLDGVDAGGVDGGHVAEAQDDDGLEGVDVDGGFDELFCGSPQKRTVDAEQRDVGRNDAALEHVRQAVADVLFGDWGDGGGVCNAVDVEQRGEAEADGDGDGEVGEDGEREGDQPDGDGGEVEAEDGADFVPLAHVVGDDKEDGGERGERNVAGQRRGDEQDAEQREGVDDAGDGRARAGANVGGGAGDGAGGGNAAEERRDDVGECPERTSSTLELWRSPVMPSATTAESMLSSAASMATVKAAGMRGRMCSAWKSGKAKGGKPRGMPPNLAADGFNGQMKRKADRGADQDGDDGGRNAAGEAREDAQMMASVPRPRASA